MNTKGAYCNNSEFNYNLRRNDTITYENNMEISNAYPIRSNELRGGWGVVVAYGIFCCLWCCVVVAYGIFCCLWCCVVVAYGIFCCL